MSKKKILVVAKTLNEGGISKFIERTYSSINVDKLFDITVLTLTTNNDIKIIKNLENSGIKVISVEAINKAPYKYFRGILKVFRNNKFDIVHWHTDNWVNVFPILLAMKEKNTKVIVQSHNSSNTDVVNSKIKMFIQNHFIEKNTNWDIVRIAVSEEAAKWMFGSTEKVQILANPINVEKFKYSEKDRKFIRKKYGIENEIAFGNVGRFKEQKNQMFLLDIFNEIRKLNSNVKLILIGSGPLEEKIDNKIKKFSLQNEVIKVKWTDSVDKFYSAFDEIIFPSLYEGFPLSLIEAQSTGCPVIFSDSITKKVKIVNSTVSCSLERGSKFWAKKALENLENSINNRIDTYKILLNQSFDYSSYNKKMINLYYKV